MDTQALPVLTRLGCRDLDREELLLGLASNRLAHRAEVPVVLEAEPESPARRSPGPCMKKKLVFGHVAAKVMNERTHE